MKRRALLLTLLAAIVLPLMSDVARASCLAFTPDFERGIPVVAEGVFLEGPTAPDPSQPLLITPARFQVTQYLKGSGPREIAIRTNYKYWARAFDVAGMVSCEGAGSGLHKPLDQ